MAINSRFKLNVAQGSAGESGVTDDRKPYFCHQCVLLAVYLGYQIRETHGWKDLPTATETNHFFRLRPRASTFSDSHGTASTMPSRKQRRSPGNGGLRGD